MKVLLGTFTVQLFTFYANFQALKRFYFETEFESKKDFSFRIGIDVKEEHVKRQIL